MIKILIKTIIIIIITIINIDSCSSGKRIISGRDLSTVLYLLASFFHYFKLLGTWILRGRKF